MKKSLVTSLVAAAVLTALPVLNSLEAYKASGSSIVCGDADDDGIIDAFDLALIRREAAQKGSAKLDPASADANADGIINVKDVAEIQDYILRRRDDFSKEYNGIYSGRTNELTYPVEVGEKSRLYFTVTSKAPTNVDGHMVGDMALVGAFLSPDDKELEIPETVEMNGVDYNVLAMNDDTFSGQVNLEKVTLNNNLTNIGSRAFKDCTALTNVDKKKADDTFSQTELKDIGSEAFSGCTSLSSIGTIQNVESVGDRAFSGCKSLTYVGLNGARSIGTGVFSHSGVNRVGLGASFITEIPDETFLDCDSLLYITLPMTKGEKIKRVGKSAFEGCTKFNIQDGYPFEEVTAIDDRAFNGCIALERTPWTVDTKLEYLGEYAFEYCSKLEKLDLSEFDIDAISNGCFSYCIHVRNVDLPNNIKSIGYKAFYNCKNIQSVYMPDGFEKVGNCAFEMCSELETVMLPETTKEIGNNAFNYCGNMKYFVFKSPDVKIGDTAVGYKTYLGTVYGKTKDLVVYGNGGTAKKYAEENEFEYKDLSDELPARIETIKEYPAKDTVIDVDVYTEEYRSKIWRHDNNSPFYDNNSFYMYDESLVGFAGDYLFDGEKKYHGICYGLASLSTMAMNGDVDYTKWNSYLGYDDDKSIFEVQANKKLATFITYVWTRSKYENQKYCLTTQEEAYGRSDKKSSVTTEEERKELFTYLEYTNYGADLPVIIIVDGGKSSHAVSGIKFEKKEDGYWEKSGKQYDARMFVYDNNKGTNTKYTIDDASIIYMNTQTGEWKCYMRNSESSDISALYFNTDPDQILRTGNHEQFADAESYLNGLLEAISSLG